MFDRLTDLHERSRGRSTGGFALSLLVHALVLGALLYGSEQVRSSATRDERDSRAALEGRQAGISIPGQNPPDSASAIADGAPADASSPGIMLPPELLDAADLAGLLPRLPDTLELGRPQTIRLAIPPSVLPEDSVLTVGRRNGVGMSPVQLTRARLAALFGESFVVRPESPPLQMADSIRRTEWHWTVTPTEAGLQTLHLQLDAPARIGGRSRIVTLHRLRQDIYVQTTPLQRISSFFSRHWTWLTVLVLFALFVTTRGWLSRR